MQPLDSGADQLNSQLQRRTACSAVRLHVCVGQIGARGSGGGGNGGGGEGGGRGAGEGGSDGGGGDSSGGGDGGTGNDGGLGETASIMVVTGTETSLTLKRPCTVGGTSDWSSTSASATVIADAVSTTSASTTGS